MQHCRFLLFRRSPWEQNVKRVRPVRGGQREGEAGALRAPSGSGDLVGRHEPRVPEGPERNSAVGSDHQVGDAAIIEGEPEPAFRRKLQCSGEREREKEHVRARGLCP